MIGIDIGTLHDHPTGLCSANPGISVLADGGLAAGVVRNSECRLGAWGGWAVDAGCDVDQEAAHGSRVVGCNHQHGGFVVVWRGGGIKVGRRDRSLNACI